MTSRKEEERNEKIIRGLMKLPPNRRCINCNSMGPQYVCTNFWTFVCMTCSGIHREFTHRVKSVSMAKFTSEEVEALQKGGNQRAREIYLKHWDPQRHRLPDNSNTDKVREFIRNVYLDKKYVGGGSSDRPPRDLQNGRSHDEEIRRASSYHSYSQSPPYDFQYEERRYGKNVPVLTRKPGSDRGLYEGKISSFLSPGRLSDRSPGRLSDHTYEDNITIERADSRISDYSASSGGDPFRSNIQSPNFQRGFGSPSSATSRDFSSSEDIVNFTGNPNTDLPARKSFGGMLHSERTASLGSFGSLDPLSFKSVNSSGWVNATHEHEQSMEAHKDQKSTLISLSHPSVSGNFDGLDLFNAPFAPETVSSSTSATNVSQLPGASSARLIDLLQPSTSTAPTVSTNQQLLPMLSPSMDILPESSPEPLAANFGDKPHFVPQNEGWATFDAPQQVVPLSATNCIAAEISASDANPLGNFDPLLFLAQWPSVQDNSAHGPSPVMPPMWNANMQNVETLPSTARAEVGKFQSWNAFEDLWTKLGEGREQVPVHQSSFVNQHESIESKDINKKGIPAIGMESLSSGCSVSLSPDISLTPQDPSTGHCHALGTKSTNPFDLPYDAEFFGMSSLQATLPTAQSSSPFSAGANEHWFSEDSHAPYSHAGSEGGFGFVAGHAQSSQISTVSSHGPVASVGGNPFA